jgi:hypothetical protein
MINFLNAVAIFYLAVINTETRIAIRFHPREAIVQRIEIINVEVFSEFIPYYFAHVYESALIINEQIQVVVITLTPDVSIGVTLD